MAITPVELRNIKFERKLRGYDPFYVDTIIAEAATEMEKLIDANNELLRQVKTLEERLGSYQNIEQSLKDALLTAQQAATEMRSAAEREAEVRLQEIDVLCKQLKAEHMSELDQIKYEIASLRMQKVRFVAELKSLIEAHLKMLEDREKPDTEAVAEHETTV